MKKCYVVLKHRFNENYCLVLEGKGFTPLSRAHWVDEKRWDTYGNLETDNPLILNSPTLNESGSLEISQEVYTMLSEDIKLESQNH